MGALDRYLDRRDFDKTPEPSAPGRISATAPRYSMQKHAATRLHWDLRLEWDGVLLSWAVTRGPSPDPGDKRLAVRTEDHPLSYLEFEGVIPRGNYGAGTVMLWDLGHWEPLGDVGKGLAKGHLRFNLHGRRCTGGWQLVRMKGKGESRENWLMLKDDDETAHQPALIERYRTSVATNRDLEEIAADAPARPFGPEREAKAPKFRKPQLATLDDDLGDHESRWHELKLDGYRALVSLGQGGATVWTRNGHDWSDRFAALLPAFEELPAETALIDAEIVAGGGMQGFAALQKAIKGGGPFDVFAFDLLHLDGEDVARRPLRDRRAALERLFADVPPRGLLRLSPVVEGQAEPIFDTICAAGGEGLISKRTDAPYRSGRSTAWLKIKCDRRAEFLIVGWQASDKRGRAFSSLLLATQEDEGLVYRGKVGTGFDAATQVELAERMAPLARNTPPVADAPDERGVTWLTPRLVAEIRYTEVTGEGRLRHPAFVALREDKMPDEVRMDAVGKVPEADREKIAGVGISSADRVVFPGAGLTKGDLARYYETVAERMLRVAADRPLSLVRMPEGLQGDRFFQKHAGRGWPAALRRVKIEESGGKTADYMYVDDAAGLVGAVQMGTIEFHVWGARRDRLDRPDRMVFDLDPDEGLGWGDVRSAACDLRDLLGALGLSSQPLVTGGKGIHVVVPLRRVSGWATVKLFSQTFAAMLAEREPKRFTANMSKARRKGRIFVDYLRNERGSTAIAPFSVRARPGAPVAVPVTWAELEGLSGAAAFSTAAAVERSWDDADAAAPASLTDKVVAGLERVFA